MANSAVPPFASPFDAALVGIIPVVAAVVGYGTNVLAVRMMFWPLRYIGIRLCGLELPGLLGWQGIVPQRAEAMAQKSVKLLTESLLTVDEVFSRLDPHGFAAGATPSLWRLSSRLSHAVLEIVIGAEARDALPTEARRELVAEVTEQSTAMTAALLVRLKERLTEVFDLEATVVRVLTREPILLVRTFQRCGAEEFRFLERSGFVFGALFGLVQMAVWLFYREAWLLPVFGAVVGVATNWLAIKIIFRPVEPVQRLCGSDACCCGRVPVSRLCCGRPIQGLFLTRQDEVSEEFGSIVAREVVTAEHIVDDLHTGPGGEVLRGMVTELVELEVDRLLEGMAGAAVTLAMGPGVAARCKATVAAITFDSLPGVLMDNGEALSRAFDIEPTLVRRLKALPPSQFEQLLHPVFEDDEYKLVLAGAAIGALVGLLQAAITWATAPG